MGVSSPLGKGQKGLLEANLAVPVLAFASNSPETSSGTQECITRQSSQTSAVLLYQKQGLCKRGSYPIILTLSSLSSVSGDCPSYRAVELARCRGPTQPFLFCCFEIKYCHVVQVSLELTMFLPLE